MPNNTDRQPPPPQLVICHLCGCAYPQTGSTHGLPICPACQQDPHEPPSRSTRE